ncbi:MAG: hypothetical protein HQK89_15980 [Nitrospirae bacterium]|nr:hypothetical protein [Nitrospirota bacterium]
MTDSTHNSSVVYRLLLLAMLPVIAAILYFTGQKYDPALINFQQAQPGLNANASGPSALQFPAEIDGLTKAGLTKPYSKDNLYEYVDGHADYFITNGFNSLAVAEYSKTPSSAQAPEVVADVYDMGNPMQAFGVLTDEAGEGASQVDVGVMGFQTSQGVNFFKGRYYVKINVFKAGINPVSFAENIARIIVVKAEPFALFDLLPDLGKVVSTRYIKADYRGLDFIGPVIERQFDTGGHNLQVALIVRMPKEAGKPREPKEASKPVETLKPGEPEGMGGTGSIEDLIAKFKAFFDKTGVRYEFLDEGGKKYYKVHDPYEGDWLMVPSGIALYGVYGFKGDEPVSKILERIYDAVKKR